MNAVSTFKIILGLLIVLPNCTNLGACIFLRAIAASLKTFAHGTLTNLAEMVAKHGFLPAHPAAVAVDVLRQDGGIIQFSPQLGRLLAQQLVVIPGGNICVTFFAVQSANSNQFLHMVQS